MICIICVCLSENFKFIYLSSDWAVPVSVRDKYLHMLIHIICEVLYGIFRYIYSNSAGSVSVGDKFQFQFILIYVWVETFSLVQSIYLSSDGAGSVSVGDKSGQKVRSLAKAKCLSDSRKIEKDFKISTTTKSVFYENKRKPSVFPIKMILHSRTTI